MQETGPPSLRVRFWPEAAHWQIELSLGNGNIRTAAIAGAVVLSRNPIPPELCPEPGAANCDRAALAINAVIG